MIRISIFNHKGGVGKTTLTMNLAATLANSGKRVLLVDTDPQCNLTSYLIADEAVDNLLDNADTSDGQTIWSAIRPISEATGGIKLIRPLPTSTTNLFLLPGDIRLSEFEVDLAEFWGQCLQRKPKGFRGTAAISELIGQIADEYQIDYVFYDSGPNIGPLNRSIILDCNYFIIPVACDLFSLRALKTLGRTISSWITDWSTISDLAPADTYLLSGKPRFLGYVPGGFRVYGGEVATGPSHYLSKIEKEVHSQVVSILRKIDPELAVGSISNFKLGELRHFGALVPSSQLHGLPLYSVQAGTPEQRGQARSALTALATKVAARINGVPG
ncbi:ParA family protein [Myxococcus sp. MISCRS1]|nr:ParA family protein [Myxococcus sp. MISCRS1]